MPEQEPMRGEKKKGVAGRPNSKRKRRERENEIGVTYSQNTSLVCGKQSPREEENNTN